MNYVCHIIFVSVNSILLCFFIEVINSVLLVHKGVTSYNLFLRFVIMFINPAIVVNHK